jgi:hypothetical protein
MDYYTKLNRIAAFRKMIKALGYVLTFFTVLFANLSCVFCLYLFIKARSTDQPQVMRLLGAAGLGFGLIISCLWRLVSRTAVEALQIFVDLAESQLKIFQNLSVNTSESPNTVTRAHF